MRPFNIVSPPRVVRRPRIVTPVRRAAIRGIVRRVGFRGAGYAGLAAATAYGGYRLYKRRRNSRIKGAAVRNIKYQDWNMGNISSELIIKRKTLIANPIKIVQAPGAANDAFGTAPGNTIFVKGFKVCVTMRNTGSAGPIRVHLAIVQPKQPNFNVASAGENMFTDPLNTTGNELSFQSFSTSATWDQRNDCFNLNPTKYNILEHQRIIMGQSNDDHKNFYRHFEKFYRINKRMQYDTISDDYLTNNPILLVWYDTLFPNNADLNILNTIISSVGYISNKTC